MCALRPTGGLQENGAMDAKRTPGRPACLRTSRLSTGAGKASSQLGARRSGVASLGIETVRLPVLQRCAIGHRRSVRLPSKGPGPGMRMLTYFMNRVGRGLSETRRAELEKAKAYFPNG